MSVLRVPALEQSILLLDWVSWVGLGKVSGCAAYIDDNGYGWSWAKVWYW